MTVSFVDASITFFDSTEFIDFDRVLRRHQYLATKFPNFFFLFEFFSYERRKEEEMSFVLKKFLNHRQKRFQRCVENFF